MPLEAALKRMAEMAAEEVKEGEVIGLGSGSSVSKFVGALGGRGRLKNSLTVVPSSLQSQLAAESAGMKIGSSALIPKLDSTYDGADQIDRDFNMIKGGGGALFRERILLSAAKKRVILADQSKFVDRLNMPVPVEVSPFALSFAKMELMKIRGKPKLRANEKGYPQITENGNVTLDTDFGTIEDPKGLQESIRSIPGVVEAGIFTAPLSLVYEALPDGSVKVFRLRKSSRHHV